MAQAHLALAKRLHVATRHGAEKPPDWRSQWFISSP